MFTRKATLATAVLAAVSLATSIEIPLVTYDGDQDSIMLKDFEALVDPVMGGQSTGEWSMNETASFGRLDAEVKDVPSLEAPGFATAGALGSYPDASSAFGDDGGILLTVKSSTYSYTGYRISFAAGASSPSYSCAGGGALPFSRGCFKADFSVPPSGVDTFVDVFVPYTSFSDLWDSATGDQTTTCAEDTDVCPTADSLGSLQYLEVWAEGVDGVIQIDVSKISAVSSSSLVYGEEPCCATCSGNTTHYWALDTPQNECAEACLTGAVQQAEFWVLTGGKGLPVNLTDATPCAARGFTYSRTDAFAGLEMDKWVESAGESEQEEEESLE
uniref:Uncharacterized protein n=1 Tax=Octactis speculum TaxID=3111310 RepID=A0A7S2AHM6_9STRA|mmetsp:Transcript_10179/g.13304  ORF Transcript_10179/g.13304 Transcript_10179/m.13304 type:complete len:330 (+) Transcript_10179:46-1035(+)